MRLQIKKGRVLAKWGIGIGERENSTAFSVTVFQYSSWCMLYSLTKVYFSDFFFFFVVVVVFVFFL